VRRRERGVDRSARRPASSTASTSKGGPGDLPLYSTVSGALTYSALQRVRTNYQERADGPVHRNLSHGVERVAEEL
jgi:hypothetical protein